MNEKVSQLSKEVFGLTEEEKSRLKNSPFSDLDTNVWNQFAGSIYLGLVSAYEAGEISLLNAINTMWNCSLGCNNSGRNFYLGLLAGTARRICPKTINARRPPYSKWNKKAAVDIVILLKEKNPDIPLGPHSKQITIIHLALKQLKVFELDLGDLQKDGKRKSLSEKTLHEWFLKSSQK